MPAEKYSSVELEQMRVQKASVRAVASFVLGICSIILCAVPCMLIAAVVGLMLEKDSVRWGYHRYQAPAKVLCIIGTVLCSLAIAAILAILFAAGILAG